MKSALAIICVSLILSACSGSCNSSGCTSGGGTTTGGSGGGSSTSTGTSP